MSRATSDQDNWATLGGLDLFVGVDRGSGLRAGLERSLREAIADGRLRGGTRLPSTRTLASDLGVSRGTVLDVYMHLAAEGWIRGRRGSGTVVAAIGKGLAAGERPAQAPEEPRHDLRAGRPDPTSFPRAAWVRALRRALAEAPPTALGVGEREGRPELREQLTAYLARARGLRVQPHRVLVTTGFTQSLGLVAHALAATGATTVAMEDPCLSHYRAIVAAAGLRIVPLPVDSGGAQVERLPTGGRAPQAVVLTPNRQHPLGMPLAPARRAGLLEWARSSGAVVIEDDYDGEFRYDGAPIGALQAFEPGRVIYAGTTSKTLAPGVRLGWLVLPPDFYEPVRAQKLLVDPQTGALEQLALAELIRSGEYDRHVRKMRLRYRKRRDVLVASLRACAPDRAIGGTAAGLNVHLPLEDADAEREVLRATTEQGVAVHGLVTEGYPHRADAASPAGLLVGYAAAPEHAYAAAVRALVSALSGLWASVGLRA